MLLFFLVEGSKRFKILFHSMKLAVSFHSRSDFMATQLKRLKVFPIRAPGSTGGPLPHVLMFVKPALHVCSGYESVEHMPKSNPFLLCSALPLLFYPTCLGRGHTWYFGPCLGGEEYH